MKRYFSILFILVLMPLAGLFWSSTILQDMAEAPAYQDYRTAFQSCDASPKWRGKWVLPTLSFIPQSFQQSQNSIAGRGNGGALPEKCRQWREAHQLQQLSIGLVAASLFFPLFYGFIATLAKSSKHRMIFWFPKLMRFSLIFLAILMLGNGLLMAMAIDLGQSVYMTENYWWITVFFLLGALSVVFKLISVLFQFGQSKQQFLFGKRLSEEDYPTVYALVANLATELKAKKPENIVVGFEPNFFVSSVPTHVYLNEAEFKGTILYLSLPLCRLLSKQEIITIIAHELGHFRGGDTEYTLHFAPVYRKLELALGNMYNDDGSLSLWSIIPANMLIFMQDVFLEAEGRLSKAREFEADRASMEVSKPHVMATSLMKLSLFSFLWDEAVEQNSLRLERGLYTRNLSSAFANIVRYDVAHDKALLSIDEILKSEVSHPSDTHPTTEERILAVNNGKLPSFELSDLKIPDEAAITIFDNFQALEEELTHYEHLWAVEINEIVLPEHASEEDDLEQIILEAVYYVIAGVIIVDNNIHESEIEVAEDIAFHLIPHFQPVDFREVCHHPDQIDNIDLYAKTLAEVLSTQGQQEFIKMLLSIANADAQYLESEHEYIAKIRSIFEQRNIG